MKKAIFTLVSVIAMASLIVVPEKVSFLFFIDYTLRLCVLGFAGNKLVQLDKQKA